MLHIWGGGESEVTATGPRKPGETLYITALETPEPTFAVELRAEYDPEQFQRAIDALREPYPEPMAIWVPALLAAGAVVYAYLLIRVFETALARLLG